MVTVGNRAVSTRSDALRLVGLYVVLRCVGVAVLAATRAGQDVGWRRVFAPWDGPFYLSIARHGYPDRVPAVGDGIHATAAFFPGFPLVIRAVTLLTGLSPTVAAVLANLLLGGVATCLFLALARTVLTPDAARRAGLMFVCMPGMVVFSLVMSDGLLITLALGTLLALHRRHWLVAGTLAAAATLTRPNALGLIAAAVVAATIAWRRGERRAVVAPLLAPLGILGYWAWLDHHTGVTGAWFTIQDRFWHQRFDLGYKFLLFAKNPVELAHNATYIVTELGFFFLALAAWAMWRGARIPVVPAAYTAVALAQMLLYSGVGPRARFVLAAFPLIWLVVQPLVGRWFALTLGVLVVAQITLTWSYSAQFVIP